MNNDDLVKVLQAIKAVALIPYPLPDESRCDHELVFAIGEIAGKAMKAIAEWKRRQGAAAS